MPFITTLNLALLTLTGFFMVFFAIINQDKLFLAAYNLMIFFTMILIGQVAILALVFVIATAVK